MRTKVTLVLLFLNVALFFFIFKFEGSWRTERASLETRRRVFGAEAADIRTLSVTSTTPGGSFSLARRNTGWFLTAPLEWPANPSAVSSILTELQVLDHEASFAVADLKNNGQSLADYGLDKPHLTLSFTSGDNAAGATPRTTTIQIGDATKIGDRLYLLSADGERIHVVRRILADSLSLPLEQLRTDTVLTIPVFEARGLRLQSASSGAPVAINRDGARWTFGTPIVARASKEATDLTLSALGSLHAKAFITANPPATLPSAAPTLRVTIEGNNRRETLFLGEKVAPAANAKPDTPGAKSSDISASADYYYAQLDGRPALFTVSVPGVLLNVLLNAQKELRETRVLDFDPRTVTAITLAAPNQPSISLQRDLVATSADAAPWQVLRRGDNSPAPQTLPADRAAVQRLLEQLSLLTAQKFSSDAPSAADLENWGFNRPEREITITLGAPASTPGVPTSTAGSELTLQLGLATQRDNFVYARLSGASPSVYAVSSDILRETPLAVRTWRERLVRELPAGARITTLKLTDLLTNAVVLETSVEPPANSKSETPTAKPVVSGEAPVPEPQKPELKIQNLRSVAASDLAVALRVLRAKSFPQDSFTEKIFVGGEERPWRYRLDATVALPAGAAGEQTTTSTLLFSERIGGTQQFAGSAESNTVFEIEQSLVDALWAITYGARDPGPIIKPQP